MNQAIKQLQSQIDILDQQIKDTQKMMDDPDMAQMAADEVKDLKAQKSALEASLDSLQNDGQKQPSNTK